MRTEQPELGKAAGLRSCHPFKLVLQGKAPRQLTVHIADDATQWPIQRTKHLSASHNNAQAKRC